MLIGFAGPMGSGKTTAARCLPWVDVQSFAKPLKEAARILYGYSMDQLYTLEGKNTVDETWGEAPRESLQWLGTECLRARYPSFWVLRMKSVLSRLDLKDGMTAIDDVRFEDEAELIRRQGGVIVHITGRGAEAGFSEHASEKGIEKKFGDHIIDNSGSITDLKRKLTRLLVYEKAGLEGTGLDFPPPAQP